MTERIEEETPTISIVIPTHRRPEFLKRAVSSVIDHGDRAFEIVVVGDHDDTPEETLRAFAGEPRLKIFQNLSSRGAAATRNVGVARATGDRVLFLDDDDELLPDYVDHVGNARNAVWGFGSFLVRHNADSSFDLMSQRQTKVTRHAQRTTPFRRMVAGLGSGFWIDRQIFLAIGGLSETLVIDEDTDLCCRLIAQGHLPLVASHPAVLVDRTEATERLTNRTAGEAAARCYLETLKRNYDALKGHPGAREFLAFRAQRRILRNGDKQLLEELHASIPDARIRALLHLKRLLKGLAGRASF